MKAFVAFAALSLAVVVTSASAANLNTLPPGPVAPTAAPGDLGMAIMGAVVESDGSLVRGEGAMSTSTVSTGTRTVVFGRNITACIYSIDVATTVDGTVEGSANAAGLAGNPNGIYVQTRNTAGSLTNLPFHVIIYCGR